MHMKDFYNYNYAIRFGTSYWLCQNIYLKSFIFCVKFCKEFLKIKTFKKVDKSEWIQIKM